MATEIPKLTDSEKALIQAAIDGDVGKTRELLWAGTGANVRNAETYPLGYEWNTTPLMCAAAGGHLDVMRILLDARADVAAATEAHKADGGGGSQALHHALKRNQLDAARLLLAAGADPNALGKSAWTPLTCALQPMSLAGVRLLLERGAQANLKVKRKDYQPPLYVAASVINNTSSMVSRNGKPVLEVAEIWERKDEVIEIFHLLIAAGADPNAPGARNGTALKALVRGDEMPHDLRIPLVELLMNAGARPDLADKDGHTPLSMATRYENPHVLELLNRPVQPQQPEPVKPEPAKKSKGTKSKAAAATGSAGARDFVKFISDGEAEWALVAVNAPIDETTNALTAFLKAGNNVKPNVQVKPAAKGTDEIAKAVAIVAVVANSWTVVVVSLFYANDEIIRQATEAAQSLSSQLKTSAVAYVADGTSDEANILHFESGEMVGDEPQQVDEDEADEIFKASGIYLPACYPKSKAGDAWLAVEKPSANRIERADLIAL